MDMCYEVCSCISEHRESLSLPFIYFFKVPAAPGICPLSLRGGVPICGLRRGLRRIWPGGACVLLVGGGGVRAGGGGRCGVEW